MTQSPIPSVKVTAFDGVEREIRFTFGAQRRIIDGAKTASGELWAGFGMPAMQVLNRYDTAALPELLWCCMFDEKGKPPQDLDPVEWREKEDPENGPELYGVFMECITKGRVRKNEFAAQIRTLLEESLKMMLIIPGLDPGALLDKSSESAAANSGTSPSENTILSVSDTKSSEPSAGSAPV